MIARLIATLAIAALLAAPAVAGQISGDFHYTTALNQLYGSSVPWTGALDLHVAPDGIVNGYYHPAGERSFVPVTGGLDGHRIWFDIQGAGRAALHVSGTLGANGTIDGSAWRSYSGLAGATVSPMSYPFGPVLMTNRFAFTAAPRPPS